MGEEKFAALNPGLLARKGAAKPAMRRQAYMNPQGDVAEEDLGWNDMGTPPPSQPSEADQAWKDIGLQPPSAVEASDELPAAPSPARVQQDQLADDLGGFSRPVDAESTRNGGDHSVDAGSLPGEDIEQRNGFTGFGSHQEDSVGPKDLEPVNEPFEPEFETPEIESHAAQEAEAEAEAEAEEVPDTGLHSDAEEADNADEQIASESGETSADEEEYVPRNGVLNPLSPETANVNANPVKVRLPSHNKIMARDKVAFTLRLDKDRHLKLRLASAVSNQSAQLLVTEALDEFLKTIPELEALAERAPDRKSN